MKRTDYFGAKYDDRSIVSNENPWKPWKRREPKPLPSFARAPIDLTEHVLKPRGK